MPSQAALTRVRVPWTRTRFSVPAGGNRSGEAGGNRSGEAGGNRSEEPDEPAGGRSGAGSTVVPPAEPSNGARKGSLVLALGRFSGG
jgi:hypothetical protein